MEYGEANEGYAQAVAGREVVDLLKDLNINVPNISDRDWVPKEAIQTVVDHIANTFDPEKIILFGSYRSYQL